MLDSVLYITDKFIVNHLGRRKICAEMMEEGKARIFAFALPEAPRFSFLFLRKLKAQATQAAKGDFVAALLGSTRAVPGMPVVALLVGEREVYVCVCVWGGVFPVCPELDSWRLAPTLSPSEGEAAELHSGSEVESP